MEMKKILEKSKGKTLNKDKGFYNCEISEYEYVFHMEEILEMYQQEQDVKEVLFYSINEKEDPMVLSTYFISYKTLIFIHPTEYDSKKELQERVRFKM